MTGKGLERDLDGLSGGHSLFPGFRQNSRDRVPYIPDRCVTEDRTIGHDEFQPVGTLDILGGDDSDHARHLFGGSCLNGFDSGMGMGAVDHGQSKDLTV